MTRHTSPVCPWFRRRCVGARRSRKTVSDAAVVLVDAFADAEGAVTDRVVQGDAGLDLGEGRRLPGPPPCGTAGAAALPAAAVGEGAQSVPPALRKGDQASSGTAGVGAHRPRCTNRAPDVESNCQDMNSLTGWGGANVEHASALNGPELTRTALNCGVATSVESICPGRRLCRA
jgi:hypothetical protein